MRRFSPEEEKGGDTPTHEAHKGSQSVSVMDNDPRLALN